MNTLYATLGITVFVLWSCDIVKTTLSSQGGGIITNTTARTVWALFYKASGRRARSTIFRYSGLCVLVSILLVWIGGLWLSLFLLLLSDPGSVVNSTNNANAGTVEKLYYAGFTLSTLGVGDYKAGSDLWRVVTSISSFTGLVLITSSVTYFVPVLSAVNVQNRISMYIHSMGSTPQEILNNSWNGRDFSDFINSTEWIGDLIMQHTLHHYSYPALHYFHNTEPSMSIKRCLVQLSETCDLLKYAVIKSDSIDHFKLRTLEQILAAYHDMVIGYVRPRCDDIPPVPCIESLREKGLPLRESVAVQQIFIHQLQGKRQLLTSLLMSDGWKWSDVYPPHERN